MPESEMQGLNTYHLSGVDVTHYTNGIAELFGKPGINVSAEQITAMFKLIDSLNPRPKAVMTNRKNQYSFSFEAIQVIKEYKGVKALAILTYSRTSFIAAKFARSKHFEIRVFYNARDEAMNWLKQVQAAG